MEKITQLSDNEWFKLSKSLFQYSKAVENALNHRAKGSDEVNKIYLWCFCVQPYDHLHFNLKPKMKSVEEEGSDFVNYCDPQRFQDEENIMDIMEEIKRFL